MFYAENGLLVTLTTLVQIFYLVGLYTNLGKNKSMTFSPGFIWGHMGKDAYKRQAAVKGVTF